eukprot:CFRG0048T1
MPSTNEPRRSSRKRLYSAIVPEWDAGRVRQVLEQKRRILVISGAGLSASAGLATFSAGGGYYEQAKTKYVVKDGKELFHYRFYVNHPAQCQAFVGDIAAAARNAKPTLAHHALVCMHKDRNALLRHYTMNIDGLHQAAGAAMWDGFVKYATDRSEGKTEQELIKDEKNRPPVGTTVELHGTVHEVVETMSRTVRPLDDKTLQLFRARKPVCDPSSGRPFRFKVLLYGDKQGDAITSSSIFEVLKVDAAQCDAVVWLGVSFVQPASCEYFRLVSTCLRRVSHHYSIPQLIISPNAKDALSNLSSAVPITDLSVEAITATADDALAWVCNIHKHEVKKGRLDI